MTTKQQSVQRAGRANPTVPAESSDTEAGSMSAAGEVADMPNGSRPDGLANGSGRPEATPLYGPRTARASGGPSRLGGIGGGERLRTPGPGRGSAETSARSDRAGAESDDDRCARAWLSRVVEPGGRQIADLIDDVGPVELMARIRSGEVPAALRSATEPRRCFDAVEEDFANAAAHGIRFLVPGDQEWPQTPLHPTVVATKLGEQSDVAPPWALWVRGSGRLDELLERCVAIIGARASTQYGEHCAAELAFALAERGWTVISGGAYGIDAAAHRGALAGGGPTVAFLASGLDAPYPPGNRRLFDRIVQNGALVSEWPPGATPLKRRFLIRNRLIAACAAGTIVVEAAARSGTSNTASQVKKLGRTLMAVPGPVTSAMSTGTHRLLRSEGAKLVTRIEDVLEEVGRIGDDLAPAERSAPTDFDRLDPLARRVLEGLPARRVVTPEQIAMMAAVPVADVLRALPILELDRHVRRREGGWQLCRATRPRRA